MYLNKIVISALLLIASLALTAQESTGIQAEIRKMSKETDPVKCVGLRD